MRIRNRRARGARGTNRGRGETTTPLPSDSDDPEHTDAALDGTEKTYQPEGEQQ